jgi:hypothetical protein
MVSDDGFRYALPILRFYDSMGSLTDPVGHVIAGPVEHRHGFECNRIHRP